MQRRELPLRDETARLPDLPSTRRRTGGTRLPGVLRRPGVLRLQRVAGNRAVSSLLGRARAVQRVEIYPKGGGRVTDVNGPGTNERKPVLAVQQRLIALGAMTQDEADADRARMDARTGRIMAGDITNTTAAITKCELPTLTEPAARKALKVDLVAGVGTGETNDAADVELVLNLLHEESHVSKTDFDAASVVLEGIGRTVDPALLPGFLAGLTKLKKSYAGGYPWRGSTKRRRGLKVTDGTAAYQKAVNYNLAGRAAMNGWLDGAIGQTRDKVLRNSAEWARSGRVKLYCQTRTHDSAARVRAASQPRRFVAIFGHPAGALSEAPVPYLRKLRGETAFDNTNVAIEADSGGFNTPGEIGIVDPRRSGKKYFMDSIKHEVQHAADHTPETDVGHYQSEVNARWTEGKFDYLSPRRRIRRMGQTWTVRQYAIFRDLWDNHDLYGYVKDNWNDSNAANRAAWRTMVVGYRTPAGFNPINSVRIETLSEKMTACSTADCLADDKFLAGTGPANARAGEVRAAIRALDDLDRKTVAGHAQLNALALTNLAGKLRDEYLAIR